MIVGFPYLDTGLRGFVGYFLVILSGGGPHPTPNKSKSQQKLPVKST